MARPAATYRGAKRAVARKDKRMWRAAPRQVVNATGTVVVGWRVPNAKSR